MDKTSLAIIVGICCSVMSSFATADSACTDVTAQIYTYDQSLPTSASNVFPYPWQDITWLVAKLGPGASSTTFTETQASWKQYAYSLIEDNGALTKIVGQTPPKVTPQSNIAATTNVLGQPDSLQTNTMTQYTWTCSDSNSNLTVTNNITAGAIVNYKGTYCVIADQKQSCHNFSNYQPVFPSYKNIGVGLQNAALYVQHPPLQPQYSDKQAMDVALNQTLDQVDKAFQIYLTTFPQLQQWVTQNLISYYAKLSSCSPGTYQYVYPFVLGGQMLSSNEVAPFFYIVEAKINGINNNSCEVLSNVKMGKNNGVMNCHYPLDDLKIFTMKKATDDSVAQNNINPDVLTRNLLKDCQIYFDGTLLSS